LFDPVILCRRFRRRARAIAARAVSLALVQRLVTRPCLEDVAAVAVGIVTCPIAAKFQANLAII
jgi:hypothetical protein